MISLPISDMSFHGTFPLCLDLDRRISNVQKRRARQRRLPPLGLTRRSLQPPKRQRLMLPPRSLPPRLPRLRALLPARKTKIPLRLRRKARSPRLPGIRLTKSVVFNAISIRKILGLGKKEIKIEMVAFLSHWFCKSAVKVHTCQTNYTAFFYLNYLP